MPKSKEKELFDTYSQGSPSTSKEQNSFSLGCQPLPSTPLQSKVETISKVSTSQTIRQKLSLNQTNQSANENKPTSDSKNSPETVIPMSCSSGSENEIIESDSNMLVKPLYSDNESCGFKSDCSNNSEISSVPLRGIAKFTEQFIKNKKYSFWLELKNNRAYCKLCDEEFSAQTASFKIHKNDKYHNERLKSYKEKKPASQNSVKLSDNRKRKKSNSESLHEVKSPRLTPFKNSPSKLNTVDTTTENESQKLFRESIHYVGVEYIGPEEEIVHKNDNAEELINFDKESTESENDADGESESENSEQKKKKKSKFRKIDKTDSCGECDIRRIYVNILTQVLSNCSEDKCKEKKILVQDTVKNGKVNEDKVSLKDKISSKKYEEVSQRYQRTKTDPLLAIIEAFAESEDTTFLKMICDTAHRYFFNQKKGNNRAIASVFKGLAEKGEKFYEHIGMTKEKASCLKTTLGLSEREYDILVDFLLGHTHLPCSDVISTFVNTMVPVAEPILDGFKYKLKESLEMDLVNIFNQHNIDPATLPKNENGEIELALKGSLGGNLFLTFFYNYLIQSLLSIFFIIFSTFLHVLSHF